MGKEKEKGFPTCWAGGGGEILAHPGAVGGPAGPSATETTGDGAVARAHTSAREGGLTARSSDGGGGVDRSSTAGEIRRWFSAVGPVLWRGSGGEARVGIGDHGGGVNLTGGGLGWPVHSAVRSPARQPSAIGGGDRCVAIVSEWQSSSTKLIRPKSTREGRTKLTGVKGGCGDTSSIGLGKVWRRWSGLVWRKQSSGGPFYRRPGGGRMGEDGKRRRACHDGGDGENGDEMAQAGEG
jgi:hypothetical protein